jgi:hypothetical protein
MDAGGDLDDTEFRVQASQQMLDGLELALVPQRKRFGQVDLDLHAATRIDETSLWRPQKKAVKKIRKLARKKQGKGNEKVACNATTLPP